MSIPMGTSCEPQNYLRGWGRTRQAELQPRSSPAPRFFWFYLVLPFGFFCSSTRFEAEIK